MAGELVPLVLLPRYTTYAGKPVSGPQFFSTIAMDVTEYSTAHVNVWRGVILGTTPSVKFNFEESTDQVTWTLCSGVNANEDPGENQEQQYNPGLNKRWFRVTVELGAADNVVSCWAVGFLEQRLS